MVKRKKESKKHISLQTITLCVSTSLVLVLLGVVVLMVLSAHNLSKNLRENMMVTMELQDGMTQPETNGLIASLKSKRYVSSVDFVSKEQALQTVKDEMGIDPTEFLQVNPYQASIELHMKSDYACSDSLVWIQKELQGYPKVSEIIYPKDMIDDVNSLLQRVSIVLLVLAVLLTFISFSLINNTVRLGVYARRFNIHTMKLVGAPWSVIRRPFLRKGMLVGLTSAVMASSVIAGGLYALYVTNPDMLTIVTWEVMAITIGSVFVCGFLITWFCTFISVNYFLGMKAGQLYKI